MSARGRQRKSALKIVIVTPIIINLLLFKPYHMFTKTQVFFCLKQIQ